MVWYQCNSTALKHCKSITDEDGSCDDNSCSNDYDWNNMWVCDQNCIETNWTQKWKKYFYFLRPTLQNLKGGSVLDKFFLKMILSTSQIRCHQEKSSISSGRRSKAQNGDQNLIYPSLTLLTAKLFPLKRVLKKIKYL